MLSPFVLDRVTFEKYECSGKPPRYPVSTVDAAKEICSRGLACDFVQLNSLVRAGHVKPTKTKGGKNFAWSASDIDAAMESLCIPPYYLPLTTTLTTLNIHARDFIEVWLEAEAQLRLDFTSEIVGEERVNPLDFDWDIKSRRPAKATIAMTPSKGLVARLDAILIQKQESDVERTANA
jgi:hypothetical protein